MESGSWLQTFVHRTKHSNLLVERPTAFNYFTKWFLLRLGVSELEKTLVNISAAIEILGNNAADAITSLKEVISQVSKITLQNRMALDTLLASQGGVCLIINSCCMYVDESGRISANVQKMWEQVKVVQKVQLNNTSADSKKYGLGSPLGTRFKNLGKRILYGLLIFIMIFIILFVCIQCCNICCIQLCLHLRGYKL